MKVMVMTGDEQILTLDVDLDESVEKSEGASRGGDSSTAAAAAASLQWDGKDIQKTEKLSAIGVRDGDLVMMFPTSERLYCMLILLMSKLRRKLKLQSGSVAQPRRPSLHPLASARLLLLVRQLQPQPGWPRPGADLGPAHGAMARSYRPTPLTSTPRCYHLGPGPICEALTPFQWVKLDSVKIADERLQDNSYYWTKLRDF